MKIGYVHPYHTDGSPLNFTSTHFVKTLFSAVGPEQVSAHYETISRSRRGLIFCTVYLGTLSAVARMGGYEHNNWMRSLILHQEYMLALYLSQIELRHFTYVAGPKFNIFYNVYSRYEYQQMMQGWSDVVEAHQTEFLRHTKGQIEYKNIDREYEYVKKRALINFLTNSKLQAEANFHTRTLAMLNQIQNFEQSNLKGEMKQIIQGSLDTVMGYVTDPAHQEEIKRASFESALDGIRTGVMTYKGDKILPMIEQEITQRLGKFKGLSQADESAILSISAEQRKQISDNDRKIKNEFLSQAPNIAHGAVKMNEKYKNYVTMATASTR